MPERYLLKSFNPDEESFNGTLLFIDIFVKFYRPTSLFLLAIHSCKIQQMRKSINIRLIKNLLIFKREVIFGGHGMSKVQYPLVYKARKTSSRN